MVVKWPRFLNPSCWLTSFSLWWLKSEDAALAAARGQPRSIPGRVQPVEVVSSDAAATTSPSPHCAPCTGAQQQPNNHVAKAEDGHLVLKAGGELVLAGQQQQQQQQQNHSNSSTGLLLPDSYAVERIQWQASIRERLLGWDFNVFDLDSMTKGNPLVTVTLTLLESHELLDGWKVSRQKLVNFLLRIEREYNPSPYHNSIHAADVTQTAAIILRSVMLNLEEVPKLEIFCIIVAAAVHDLGHLGVNNDFLINSKHARATRYNDKSVNEMYHISRAFEIMRESEHYNIFDGLTADEAKRARKLMVDLVLATDMAIHFDLLKNFTAQLESKPSIGEWTDRALLYQMTVHLADIANPSRPFRLARGWAERVIQEFCEQGDKETDCGLTVSPMCDRSKMNMPRAQINFIEIFLKPTLAAFERAAPDFTQMASASLELTIKEWKVLEDQGFKL